jgi:ABC-type sugar transport system substrate-binding protein
VPQNAPSNAAKWGERIRAIPVVVFLLVAVWPAVGCDSASFAPPPPDDLRVDGGGPQSKFFTPPPSSEILGPPRTGSRAVALVLARHELDDGDILRSSARIQAGYDKVRLDITMLASDDLPAQQAALVRDAVMRSPVALILEPADTEDKHLAQAVIEAQQAGVPVVFLNRSLSTAAIEAATSAGAGATTEKTAKAVSSDHGESASRSPQAPKPPILVGAPSFNASAEQLVASAMRNAKNAKLDPKRGAILVINTISDAFASDRIAAIRRALENAGVNSKDIEEVRFAYKEDAANKLIADRLKANNKAVMVFGLDSQCLPPIRAFTSEPEFETHPFVVAGYVSDDRLIPFTQNGAFAALAGFNSTRLVRKAITVAASRAQGKDTPQNAELPVEVHDSPPSSGLPKHRSEPSDLPRKALTH